MDFDYRTQHDKDNTCFFRIYNILQVFTDDVIFRICPKIKNVEFKKTHTPPRFSLMMAHKNGCHFGNFSDLWLFYGKLWKISYYDHFLNSKSSLN